MAYLPTLWRALSTRLVRRGPAISRRRWHRLASAASCVLTAAGAVVLEAAPGVEATLEAGGKVTREPGPMKHGTTVIAFVEDPDGYKIELIQLASRAFATA